MLATASSNAIPEHHFAPQHRWDRRGLLILLALIWLGVLMGFGCSIAQHLAKHDLDYPLVVHIHAAAFVGWMVLVTVQMLLIRSHQHALHKKLGLFGAGLAAFMIVIGPITAIVTARLHYKLPDSDPAFLAVSFSSILNFAVLVAAALSLRRAGAAHKRLMMLALLALAPAGFARWLGGPIIGMVGPGPFGMWCLLYLITTGLVLSIGVHDLITRRRLLPSYALGATFSLGMQLVSTWLLFSPAWLALMKTLVAR